MKVWLYLLGLLSGITGFGLFFLGTRHRKTIDAAQSPPVSVDPVQPPPLPVAPPTPSLIQQPHNLSVQLSDDVTGFAQKFLLAEFTTLWQEIQTRVQIRERISVLSVTIEGALLAFGLSTQPDKVYYFKPADSLLLAALISVFFEVMVLRQFFRIALVKDYLSTEYAAYVNPYFKINDTEIIPGFHLGWTSWNKGSSAVHEWFLSLVEANIPIILGVACYVTYWVTLDLPSFSYTNVIDYIPQWLSWYFRTGLFLTHLSVFISVTLGLSCLVFIFIEVRLLRIYSRPTPKVKEQTPAKLNT